MKLLFLARGYPSSKNRTLGVFEYDMAKAMVQAGHEVVYLAMDHRSLRRWRRFGFHSFHQDGMTILAVHLPLGRLYYPLRLFLGEKAMLHAYQKYVRQERKPDVIHAHFAGMALLGARLKEKTGIPLVITEHSSKLNHSMKPFYARELEAAYGKADVLTSVSKALSKRIHKLFGLASEVVPNVLDTETFRVEKSKGKASPFTFVSTGNLIKGKGMDALIEAFFKIHQQSADARLVIYGKGPMEDDLTHQIKAFDLTDAVRLAGLVSRPTLQEAYREASCFVLASKSETFGVAYIEAMASGLPVIATRSGGPEDYVNPSNGILINPEDPKALVEAMEWMMDHAQTYEGEEISNQVKARYAPEAVAAALEDVYIRAVGSSQDGRME